MYVIWDHSLELYSPIYLQRNDRLSIEGFKKILDEEHANQGPFSIRKIGDFDDENELNPITDKDYVSHVIWTNAGEVKNG